LRDFVARGAMGKGVWVEPREDGGSVNFKVPQAQLEGPE
jgi:hypothetical protein